mmetsp:Transcript_24554/g.58458  ORF Transcript_24554/g.58458 Transcript_24554/m.58458 type:complete len:190 (+) Transcript_24554:82-651(+)
MIDFGMFASDFSPIDVHHSTTSLHINTSSPYDGTIYDKKFWDNTPAPNDSNVTSWTQDIAAKQPQSVCDQWSAEEWNAWANKYDDIPACGTDASPERHQLEPFAVRNTEVQHQNALLLSGCQAKNTARPIRASPGHLVMCCHAIFAAAVETLVDGGDVEAFKQGAKENAGAMSAVAEELLSLHMFPVQI